MVSKLGSVSSWTTGIEWFIVVMQKLELPHGRYFQALNCRIIDALISENWTIKRIGYFRFLLFSNLRKKNPTTCFPAEKKSSQNIFLFSQFVIRLRGSFQELKKKCLSIENLIQHPNFDNNKSHSIHHRVNV